MIAYWKRANTVGKSNKQDRRFQHGVCIDVWIDQTMYVTSDITKVTSYSLLQRNGVLIKITQRWCITSCDNVSVTLNTVSEFTWFASLKWRKTDYADRSCFIAWFPEKQKMLTWYQPVWSETMCILSKSGEALSEDTSENILWPLPDPESLISFCVFLKT